MTQGPRVGAAEECVQDWLSAQNLDAPVSSYVGSADLPFQRWFRFKEAYAPAFVMDTIAECNYPVRTLLDPFGGIGTTALTARMQGLDSTSIEVNPFLADVIRAKVTPVSPTSFRESCKRLVYRMKVVKGDYRINEYAPSTLVEPGVNGRYVYSRRTYGALRSLHRRIRQLEVNEQRLARVLLGSILVDCSNVRINGKGRRYRKNWLSRQVSREDVVERFEAAVMRAVQDLIEFKGDSCSEHCVYTDDARSRLKSMPSTDLAIFSPPYPNSFDYTDVYNLELWMLGYFRTNEDNRRLRARTLRSHVQIKWPEVEGTLGARKLTAVKQALDARRAELWNRNIPEMVVGYFADLENVLVSLKGIVPEGGLVVAAVGDSQYGGVRIDTAGILAEIGERRGYTVENAREIRSMRASAQHGGRFDLSETALWFRRSEAAS